MSYKASENYELEFESGMKYHGEELEDRLDKSARMLTDKYDDPVKRKSFTPANTETDECIEEGAESRQTAGSRADGCATKSIL